MGRPRKTAEELRRSGTFRADRHGARANAPEFGGSPARPKDLSPDARKHWDLVVPALARAGVATAVDGPALEAMCEAWAEYKAAKKLKAPTIREMRQRQMLKSAAYREWYGIAAKFGLTPSDRAKIEAGGNGKGSQDDGFETFFQAQAGG